MTREVQRFTVFGFGSTHHALDAEALLDDMGIDVVPMPTPKSIGATCGIALRVPIDESDRATEYLSRAQIAVTGRTEIDDV